jgi:phage-related protein
MRAQQADANSLRSPVSKPLKGFGDAAVVELIERDSAGTYRATYTVRFADAVFVLHCFQKKKHQRHCNPEARNRRNSRPVECRRVAGKGAKTWQNV